MKKIATRERCQMCNKISPVGFHVPNDIWEKAIHHFYQNSVLCLSCFISQADEKLIAWDKDIKFYPASLVGHLRFQNEEIIKIIKNNHE